MKKLIILTGILLLFLQTADAGIISSVLSNAYYNNAVKYNNTRYPNRYYGRRYYSPRKLRPYNYYNQPIIYRNRVRRSSLENQIKNISNEFTGLERLEKKVLGQSFEYDLTKNRIERLEQKMFGTVQNGDLSERLTVLKSASKNYMSFNPDMEYELPHSYNGYRPPIITGSTGTSLKRNLLGNLKNQIMGMPTGFTPAMDPAYMDYFEAERAMMNSDNGAIYGSNHGWGYSNTQRGAGTGVRILD